MIEMFNILKQKKDEQSESIIEDGMRYFNLRIKQMKLPPPEKVKKSSLKLMCCEILTTLVKIFKGKTLI